MTEYVGWCPEHGPLEEHSVAYRTMMGVCGVDTNSHGIVATCMERCTGPGADAALAALKERDELRKKVEDLTNALEMFLLNDCESYGCVHYIEEVSARPDNCDLALVRELLSRDK